MPLRWPVARSIVDIDANGPKSIVSDDVSGPRSTVE